MRLENLPTFIRVAGDLAAAGTGAKGTQVRMRFDPRAELVLGNKVQLQQVIFNLVRNAFEAMVQCEGQEVELATNRLDSGSIEIVIADRGPGLPEEVEHLFEPFRNTKRNGVGWASQSAIRSSKHMAENCGMSTIAAGEHFSALHCRSH
jgi:C4-dicarboxylate-specific signal transduction histidine kinase